MSSDEVYPVCYRHPERTTLVSCSSCERPICTDCMQQASVGIRCPECRGTTEVRDMRSISPGGMSIQGSPATAVLVALNIVAFLGEVVQGGLRIGSSTGQIVRDGALFAPSIADGEWWRLVTSGFLHYGLLHILFNLWALTVLGGALERVIGTPRYIAVFAASLLGGSAGALLVDNISGTLSTTVGASGGVFGVMAALFILERQQGASLMQSQLGMLLVLNLVLTFGVSGISIGGHIGGLVSGALAALILSGFGRNRIGAGKAAPAAWIAISVLLVTLVSVSFLVV